VPARRIRKTERPISKYLEIADKEYSNRGRSVIAVIDDEASVRKAVVRLLGAAGFAVRGFSSAKEFLDTWHFDRPDCLLLDLQMPDISGTEVQRALNVAGAQFPIIIISAHDAPDLREECLHLGAVAYLCKPLDANALLRAVRPAMGSPAARGVQ